MAEALRELISARAIATRVAEIGARITGDYAGRELLAVGILKGAWVFMADLVRHIDLPLLCDFVGITSYGDGTDTSGVVRITSDLTVTVRGRDLLIVEDIIDTGLTTRYLLNNLETRGPRSIRVCTLLDKPERREVPVSLDYVGFTIPDRFVVGYGLDYAQRYRNLPFVAELVLTEGAD